MRNRDFHAGSVDFFCSRRRGTKTGDIAVIDLHERRAESKMLGAGRITCGKSNVPIVGREAFVVARGIVVRLELDWHAKMSCKRIGNGDGHHQGSCPDGA